MLVVRNGEVVAHGIGLVAFPRFGDQIVKFPSRIHRVNFKALQTTQEK